VSKLITGRQEGKLETLSLFVMPLCYVDLIHRKMI
jgi:hypothetical protein